MPQVRIESLDHEGRGVAHDNGKTIFIDGALPGEWVEYAAFRVKANYENARTINVLKPVSSRVAPACPYFGVCGGCSMQHLSAATQTAVKQRVLEDDFWHIGRLKPALIYPPIAGTAWGYRFRARLSVRLVAKKGGVLVGFHEKRSSYVVDMRGCPVLPPHVSGLIGPLRELVARMSIADRLPQVEVALGDAATALVFRILQSLTEGDEELLRRFGTAHDVRIYLQPQGPDSTYLFHPTSAPALYYSLPDFDLRMEFRPTDFTQVNHGINRMLVRRAMGLLDVRPGERIVDMFCGLGNFTLPIARAGAQVVGIEGSASLIERARANALANGLAERCAFAVANLFDLTPEAFSALGRFDKMLIDPPREGALDLVKSLGTDAPQRIVYVSCNPATLARDAAILVHEKGYFLRGAGIANMFPQTSHVESIALFER